MSSFSELEGRCLTTTNGLGRSSELVEFICADGTVWEMFHERDRCERVYVEDVVGDVEHLEDALVLDAREETNSTDPPTEPVDATYRWTFYIQTDKGAVTIRWLSTSSERVSFGRVSDWRLL